MNTQGTLYLVATPMGNLEDITFRAVRILKEADMIAAEDTRHSRRLLDHYGIATPLTPCHDHNERQRTPALIEKLTAGLTIALISDAGTPLISDPGFNLVRAAAKAGIPVVPVPGCNAAISALSAAGLPTDRFIFLGFPPKKQGALTQALAALSSQTATRVFYESPKRVQRLIETAREAFGDRRACLARELTKIHEEFIRGTLSDILEVLEGKETVKGECVLMIDGLKEAPVQCSDSDLEAAILEELKDEPKTSALAARLAKQFNRPKREIYEAIVRLKA